MIFIPDFENIHLVILHSYTSQLSFLFAQKRFIREKALKNKNFKDLYLVFLYPSRSDLYIKNPSNINDFFKIDLLNKNSRIEIIKLVKPWQRLFLTPIFYLIRIFIKNKTYLWQPKYRWIEDSLEFRLKKLFNLKINFKIPKFKIILFGDGFMSLMTDNMPFWLKQRDKVLPLNPKRLYRSYHLFSVNNNSYQYQSKKMIPEDIRKNLKIYLKNKLDKKIHYYLEQFSKKIKLNNFPSKYYIFPTTTFYETGRSRLDWEVDLYINFLKKSKLFCCNNLIIKPHPTSSPEKNIEFIRRINNDLSFKDINIYNPYETFFEYNLSKIPLEILISYLYNFSIRRDLSNSIIIACCSTASLSIKALYPDFEFEKAFGEELIRKYIYKDFQEKRLTQEKIINESMLSI